MATTTALQGLPIPDEGDSPDPPRDFLLLANAVEKKLAAVYNDAADRDAKVTAPLEGQMAILKDVNKIHVYFDAAWTQVYPATGQVAITNGTVAPNNADGANGDVYLKV